MKKTLLALFVFAVLLYACKKETPADTPVACFTATILDSVKVQTADTARVRLFLKTSAHYDTDSSYLFSMMDSIHAANYDSATTKYVDSFFIVLKDTTPVYKQPVYFKYCGSASNFRVIYTGVPGHEYFDGTTGVATGGGGDQYTGDVYTVNYGAVDAGRFVVTVLSTNIGDKADDIKRSIAKQVIKTK